MEKELSYEALRKVQMLEKKSMALSVLEEDFFSAYGEFLKKQEESLKLEFSMEKARVYDNAKSVLNEVIEQRVQKLLLKVLKDYRTGMMNTEGLAREEKELYKEVYKIIQDWTTRFKALQTINTDKKKEESGLIRLKILMPLPEFVSASGNTLGPFSEGMVVELKQEDAGVLLKRGIGKEETGGLN